MSPSYQRDPLCDNIIVIIAVIIYKINSFFAPLFFVRMDPIHTKYCYIFKNLHNMGEAA